MLPSIDDLTKMVKLTRTTNAQCLRACRKSAPLASSVPRCIRNAMVRCVAESMLLQLSQQMASGNTKPVAVTTSNNGERYVVSVDLSWLKRG